MSKNSRMDAAYAHVQMALAGLYEQTGRDDENLFEAHALLDVKDLLTAVGARWPALEDVTDAGSPLANLEAAVVELDAIDPAERPDRLGAAWAELHIVLARVARTA